jgi:hypothetical protein
LNESGRRKPITTGPTTRGNRSVSIFGAIGRLQRHWLADVHPGVGAGHQHRGTHRVAAAQEHAPVRTVAPHLQDARALEEALAERSGLAHEGQRRAERKFGAVALGDEAAYAVARQRGQAPEQLGSVDPEQAREARLHPRSIRLGLRNDDLPVALEPAAIVDHVLDAVPQLQRRQGERDLGFIAAQAAHAARVHT